jgi:hypothetical protein
MLLVTVVHMIYHSPLHAQMAWRAVCLAGLLYSFSLL